MTSPDITSPDITALLQPVTIGPLTLRNRFALPAMQIGLTEQCGPSLPSACQQLWAILR